LKFEIWIEDNGDGLNISVVDLNMDAIKKSQVVGENGKLVHSYEAFSYFEKMSKYYKFMNWDKYESFSEDDKVPFEEKD
jgi:hypothetical protein